MNIDALLTHKEQNTIYNLLHSQGGEHTNRELADANCKAQCLKLLEWLKEEEYIHCDYILQGDEIDGKTLTQVHSPYCRVCELESVLKEVGK
jgi:hypothetical protein